MDRGKRVMQPEPDFDLNMEPPPERDEEHTMAKKNKILEVETDFDPNMEPPLDRERECKMANKIFELEAGLDNMMLTSEKEKERNKVIMIILYFGNSNYHTKIFNTMNI